MRGQCEVFAFCVWLISHNLMTSSSVHLLHISGFHSYLWLNKTIVCIYHITYSSIDGPLDWFQILAIANSATVNMRVQVFFPNYEFITSGLHIQTIRIAGSHNRFVFSFLEEPPYHPLNVYTNLQSNQQCIKVHFSLHLHQTFCFVLLVFSF